MTNVAITRKIDEMGRVVLPIDYRRRAGLREGDTVKLSFDYETGAIIMKGTAPSNPLEDYPDDTVYQEAVRRGLIPSKE